MMSRRRWLLVVLVVGLAVLALAAVVVARQRDTGSLDSLGHGE